MVVLNSPHNPSGTAFTADIRKLAALLDGTDVIIVSDEVYEHVIFDGLRHECMARLPELAARSLRRELLRQDLPHHRLEDRLLPWRRPP